MFSGLERDSNPWPLRLRCSAPPLLSYEDPYVGSRPIYRICRTRERNETYEYYVNCGHTNEIKDGAY